MIKQKDPSHPSGCVEGHPLPVLYGKTISNFDLTITLKLKTPNFFKAPNFLDFVFLPSHITITASHFLTDQPFKGQ